jgi:hypothetical protein
MNKQQYDWHRAEQGLPPRKMDWQEKVVVTGSVIAIVVFLLLLAEGVIT